MSRQRRLPTKSTAFTVLAALLATLGGTIVLAGYLLDVPALIGVLPGWAPMKPNTALCFMLNGFVLALSLLPTAPSGFSAKFAPAHRSGVLALLAVLPILIGLVTLGEYLFDWNLRVDALLVSERLSASEAPPSSAWHPSLRSAIRFWQSPCG